MGVVGVAEEFTVRLQVYPAPGPSGLVHPAPSSLVHPAPVPAPQVGAGWTRVPIQLLKISDPGPYGPSTFNAKSFFT